MSTVNSTGPLTTRSIPPGKGPLTVQGNFLCRRKVPNREWGYIFDQVASKYDELIHGYSLRRRLEILSGLAQGDCLEIGAGTGAISGAINGCRRVIAIDISAQMVCEMKKKWGITGCIADGEYLPFREGSFDTVIASECIYYFNSARQFLSEAYRVLKPSGVLLISSTGRLGIFYEYLRSFLRRVGFHRMYFDDPNRHFLSEKDLKKFLLNARFRRIETHKIIVFPLTFLDRVNRLLEKTAARHLGIFTIASAKKYDGSEI